MEPESPNTHAPEFQTGCELACSTDTPERARAHRLCDEDGLFFLLFARHLRIGPRRLFGPRRQLSVVETLNLTDTLTGLTDTPLSDFPSFNLPQITSTRRVRAWASGSMESACLDVWSAVRPCSIGSNLHTTTRRALDSPHIPSRPLSTIPHEYYGPHIARMMVSCLKSSLSRMAAGGHARVMDDPPP